jgi:lactate 2-monooxygenase
VATPETPFGAFQFEIYLRGVSGERPELPITYAELEAAAREALPAEAYGYVAGGAAEEHTMRANRAAFDDWRIVPRMLRDVSQRDLSTSLLGRELPAPLLLAPVGVLGIIRPDGELATASAAAELGVPIVLSTVSSHTLEQVAEACGDAPRWFQLYWPTDPELTESLVTRAERAGYSAVVVTVDLRMLAWRPRDLSAAYLPFLSGDGLANYTSDPVFNAGLDGSVEDERQAAIQHWVSLFSNPALTWDDLSWLRERTNLPILLKGVLEEEDARRAVEAGVDGLIVSNHGGRQVDGAIAALDALPDVVGSVPEGFPVLFDSGVRTGADVFKALALGARAVMIGRPYVWGLALGGSDGVRQVLRGLLADFDLTMALTCHTSLDELAPDVLRRAPRA